MNANQIKLSMSRNSSHALVANLYINDEEIFATSKGYQLGCALHALGITGLKSSGAGFTLAVDENGAFLGHKFGRSAKESVFIGNLTGGMMLAMLSGGGNDPEYHLVRTLLPQGLVTGPGPEATECSEKDIEYFKQFIYYPIV
ncbi:hypothetical protein GTP58_20300 [Duganella sp. CY15W]|uniref:hypothetical protein n=1 Tax=Duganella sp. CY15W TaxID=2692172 RepID=UPI00136AF59D|nr:hypothetical protein [Duganella sp. CY15W]MYM30678.1 hypothetical protein [Duganella sp. CY15W]